MKGKQTIAIIAVATLLAVISASWLVLARMHRAIALQPVDYVKAISAEIRIADSAAEAWRMVKAVSSMFWSGYEVRMVDGRAFSSLPFYRPPEKTEEQTLANDLDIDIAIIDHNENTGEVQQQN